MMSEKALQGINVLDLSGQISGPYCTKLMAAFGADVVKIEEPGCGDPARWAGPFPDNRIDPEASALFLYLNTGKKSITLKRQELGKTALLKRLIAGTDILVENFPPGYLASLGMGYDDLKKINPALIMVSITDFGQSGPYRDYRGGRLAMYALSGYMHINGDPDREPLAGGGEQPAYQGGLHAFAGVMAALIDRQATGRGRHIDVSVMECMASLHQFTINRYVYSGKIQKRSGNRHIWLHPVTVYPCRDGFVSVCASTEEQAEMLLTLMGEPDAMHDPRFSSGIRRLVNADAFDELVKPWFLARTKKEIVEVCQDWRVPATPVNDISDLYKNEQLRARKYWVDIDHPRAGRHSYAGAPFKMSVTPAVYSRAPLLGEHNEGIGVRSTLLTR
ncbi:MAG: CoA transferase, partial [Deltaproteobacteria bacterium]|nr:CoA transferase [Deltaproteobacteria bacterium]